MEKEKIPEKLFEDVGTKLKTLAKWVFVAEAFAAAITCVVLLFIDEYFIFLGIIIFVCGPIIALLSSWILYAFGELVEKSCDNEANSKRIVELLEEKTETKVS